jgi:hypothetical protein
MTTSLAAIGDLLKLLNCVLPWHLYRHWQVKRASDRNQLGELSPSWWNFSNKINLIALMVEPLAAIAVSLPDRVGEISAALTWKLEW